MNQFRVIHPITRLILGGAQQNTMDTCTYLSRSRFETSIVSGPDTGTEGELISEVRKRGISLNIIPELVRELDVVNDFLALKKMVAYFKAEKPHIVHTHSSKAGILGRWAARITGVPVIVHTVHGWGYHGHQNFFERNLFKFLERMTEKITDKLIVVSYLNAEKGLRDEIGSAEKYTTIHSSINLDNFTNVSCDTAALRKQLGLPPEGPVVGTVGRLSPQKNPYDFVKVAAAVKQQIPGARFIFVGDGPLRSQTERLIRELDLSRDIFLLGLRKDIPSLLRCMDVFILTSLWEGLPRVIPQAMAAGLPVVANAVDGVCEVIEDGINGFLIPPKNVSFMAKRITQLLTDTALRENMCAQGREKAETEFSLWEMIDRIERLYEELLTRKVYAFCDYEKARPARVHAGTAFPAGSVETAYRAFPPQRPQPEAAPMRVLHIFKEYYPDKLGGVQESIRQISKYTSDNGVRNTVLTVSSGCHPPCIDFPEARVLRHKTSLDIYSTPFSSSFFRNFRRTIQANDILHFHFPWPFAELSFLLSGISKPSLVTYHSDIVRQKVLKKFYRPLFTIFMKKTNAIVVTSENYLRSSSDLKAFRDKCTVIPLTIGCRRFPESDEGAVQAIRAEYGEDFFLFVGVLRYYKGLDFLLEAMQGIRRKLVIIGKGAEEERLKKRAAELGLSNVVFTGYVDDVHLPAFYRLCRAFVFPSCERSEAFGLSLLEASNFSKPMISTELGTGTSLVNRHEETGIVVPPKNSAELHKALKRLSENELLSRKYGHNARRRCDQMFNAEVVGRQYLKVYNDLLDMGPQDRASASST